MQDDDDIIVIVEGKAVGAAPHADLALYRDLIVAKDYHVGAFAAARKKGQTFGKKKLGEVTERVQLHLMRLVNEYLKEKIHGDALREKATKLMRGAWRDVFLAGLRAGGTPGEGLNVRIGPADDAWLKGAAAHELRYLNRFLEDVTNEGGRMPYDQRVRMYASTLSSFYESARVIALPGNYACHWINKDGECESCRYLAEHSPYTKYNLPTTPRSGACRCLSNCRCRIVVRRVRPDEALEILTKAKYTRDQHIRNLRRIKQKGY